MNPDRHKIMSGFEDYQNEFARLDKEIAHYVAVCGLALPAQASRADIDEHLGRHSGPPSSPWQSLQALLILRLRLETEAIELGFEPPELRLSSHTA